MENVHNTNMVLLAKTEIYYKNCHQRSDNATTSRYKGRFLHEPELTSYPIRCLPPTDP